MKTRTVKGHDPFCQSYDLFISLFPVVWMAAAEKQYTPFNTTMLLINAVSSNIV